jgi:hypothetical protein
MTFVRAERRCQKGRDQKSKEGQMSPGLHNLDTQSLSLALKFL